MEKLRSLRKKSKTCKMINSVRLSRISRDFSRTPLELKKIIPRFGAPTENRLNSMTEPNTPKLEKYRRNPLSARVNVGTLKLHWNTMKGAVSAPVQNGNFKFFLHENAIFLLGKKNQLPSYDLLNEEWRIESISKTPTEREGHSVVHFKNYAIMFGGVTKDKKMSSKLHVFNLNRMNWMRAVGYGTAPRPRSHHAATILGRHMVIYGGEFEDNTKSNELLLLDLKTFYWAQYDYISPDKVSHSSLTPVVHSYVKKNNGFSLLNLCETKSFYAIQNSGIYLFGGIDSHKVPNNDLFRLTGSNGSLLWEKIKTTGQAPCPRYSHAAAAFSQFLVIMGGRDDAKSADQHFHALNDLFVLNVINWKWEEVLVYGVLPAGRWGHCLLEYQNGILLLGGTNSQVHMNLSVHFLETENQFVDELVCRDERILRNNFFHTKGITSEFRMKLKELN